jgi:hypothetical protein
MRRPPPLSLAALVLLWAPLALGADRDVAERLVNETTRAPEAATAARELDAARRALGRARAARDGGDRAGAELLEGLARTWAEAAHDVVRAVRAESSLAQAQKALLEARSQVERGRALLDETLSRKGRARVELERLDPEAKRQGERAAASPRAPERQGGAATTSGATAPPVNARPGQAQGPAQGQGPGQAQGPAQAQGPGQAQGPAQGQGKAPAQGGRP